MVARTQIALEPEFHRKARARAAELGISLAEYIRELVARDLKTPHRGANPEVVFDLGTTRSSNVAGHKADYVGEAVSAERGAGHARGRRRKR